MLDAKVADETPAGADVPDRPRPAADPSPRRRPVLVVLHQQHSTSGHVGAWLVRHGHALDVRRPRFGDCLPPTLEDHAGAVIFGGPMSANDPDDYIRLETEWIGVALQQRKPFLGICLGAQMLANHLGGSVSAHPQQHVEIGYFPVTATPEGQAVCRWPAHVYQWHREGFEAPRTATLLATAEGSFAQQAFSHDGAAVGVQFHPEITLTMVHRWSGHHEQRLTAPGAQPRHAHLSGHLAHAPGVRRWLDAFMPLWLQGRVGSPLGSRLAGSRLDGQRLDRSLL